MAGDPGMGMDTGAPAGADPNAGAPAAQGDPNGAPVAPPPGFNPQGADPMAGGDPMAGDPGMGMDAGMSEEPMPDDMGGEEGGDDSTASLLDKLNDEDKEAARKYILSMLDDSEGAEEELTLGPEGSNAPMPDADDEPIPEEPTPMAESIILKKSQFKRLHENIGVSELEKDDKKKTQRTQDSQK